MKSEEKTSAFSAVEKGVSWGECAREWKNTWGETSAPLSECLHRSLLGWRTAHIFLACLQQAAALPSNIFTVADTLPLIFDFESYLGPTACAACEHRTLRIPQSIYLYQLCCIALYCIGTNAIVSTSEYIHVCMCSLTKDSLFSLSHQHSPWLFPFQIPPQTFQQKSLAVFWQSSNLAGARRKQVECEKQREGGQLFPSSICNHVSVTRGFHSPCN